MLERRFDQLPPRLQRALPWIVGQDWLTSYAELEHMDQVFAGMARRIKRDNPLPEAPAILREGRADFDLDFAEFFPELQRLLAADQSSTHG